MRRKWKAEIVFFLFVFLFLIEAEKKKVKKAETAPRWSLQIVNTFHHDNNAFTQGLYWEEEEGVFYEGTGLEGRSSLRRVDLNGTVIKRYNLPEYKYFGEGIVRFNDKIYQLTWRNHLVLIYDREFNFLSQLTWDKEGWGLTHDGTNLIVSDGSDSIFYVDPSNFNVLRSITVKNGDRTVSRLNELEYINGEIWANIWLTSEIVIINPQNGKVNALVDCKELSKHVKGGDVLNGIAYDQKQDRVFLTGKLWDKLFEIKISSGSSKTASPPPTSTSSSSPPPPSQSSQPSQPSEASSSSSKGFLITLSVIAVVSVFFFLLWKRRKTRVIVDVATLLKNLDPSRKK